jgi:hypothetical protein
MWSRLDDALIDHRKVFEAGERLGKNGPAIVLGVYVVGLMWTNRHLSDGFLPRATVRGFMHVEKPLDVARALVEARLWEAVDGGYRVHDFHDFNLHAADVQDKRKRDRERKREGGRHRGNGRADS